MRDGIQLFNYYADTESYRHSIPRHHRHRDVNPEPRSRSKAALILPVGGSLSRSPSLSSSPPDSGPWRSKGTSTSLMEGSSSAVARESCSFSRTQECLHPTSTSAFNRQESFESWVRRANESPACWSDRNDVNCTSTCSESHGLPISEFRERATHELHLSPSEESCELGDLPLICAARRPLAGFDSWIWESPKGIIYHSATVQSFSVNSALGSQQQTPTGLQLGIQEAVLQFTAWPQEECFGEDELMDIDLDSGIVVVGASK